MIQATIAELMEHIQIDYLFIFDKNEGSETILSQDEFVWTDWMQAIPKGDWKIKEDVGDIVLYMTDWEI